MFQVKEKYNIDDLRAIMKVLRSENGCPWDREQDHKSIRMDVLEEAYEVAEAIDSENGELLKEELGDLLLQIVFHSELESEQDNYNFDDVCDGICKKLIYRHPHVFGEVKVNSTNDKKTIVLKSDSTDMSDEEVEERLKALQYLKISPREEEENKQLLFKGESLYEEMLGDTRLKIEKYLNKFEEALDTRNRDIIEREREEFRDFLNSIEKNEELMFQ